MEDFFLGEFKTGEITEKMAGDPTIDRKRIEGLEIVYNIMQTIVRGDNIRVTYSLHDGAYRSIGAVTVHGDAIAFLDPTLFYAASRIASIVEFYTMADDSVQVDFTFHGLTK